jgi:mono/diheme cytochrome c family protein
MAHGESNAFGALMFRVLLVGLLSTTVAYAGAQTKPGSKSKAPATTPSAAAEKALETYKTVCAICHGLNGKGLAPDQDLTDAKWKHGSSTAAIAKTIKEGVKGTTMQGFGDKYSDAEIQELAKLVKSFSSAVKKK